jgi:hypothetical protein
VFYKSKESHIQHVKTDCTKAAVVCLKCKTITTRALEADHDCVDALIESKNADGVIKVALEEISKLKDEAKTREVRH